MFESLLAWLLDQLGAFALYGSVGLLVGWNAIPQPKFIKKYYDKVFNKEVVEKK